MKFILALIYTSCLYLTAYGYVLTRRTRIRTVQRKMFSGIVEEMGVCASFETDENMAMWDGSIAEGKELTIKLKNDSVILNDSYIGCSIAVNGVCLTATKISKETGCFSAGLAPETLRRSNLGILNKGVPVNLERAMRADGRNSGHFVQGHVGK